MKNTLNACLVAASLSLMAGSASAALFISDLSGLNAGDPLDGHVDNGSAWSISEPFDGAGDLAYGANVGGSPGFQLGVAEDIPAGGATSFFASHAVDNIALVSPSAYPTTVRTTFMIVDSTVAFPDRNDYSFGIYDSGSLLFGVNFGAVDQNVPGGIDDVWGVSFSSGASTSGSAFGVVEDGLYYMTVSFFQNGADIDFMLSIANADFSEIETMNSTLAGLAGASIDEFRVGSQVGGGADWGDGVVGVTGISVVPEPSTALLFGLSSIAMLRRRRN